MKKRVPLGIAFACLVISCFFLACNSGGGGSYIECGGGAEFACPSGMYCDYGSNCGGLDQRGKCRPQPPTCPSEDNPVCGCDGKTYDSACYAQASGISIGYEGRCVGDKNKRETGRFE